MHSQLYPDIGTWQVNSSIPYSTQKQNVYLFGCLEKVVYFYALLLGDLAVNVGQAKLFGVELEHFWTIAEHQDLVVAE